LKQEVDELKGENVRLTSKLFDLHHSYDNLVKDQEKIVKKQRREEKQTRPYCSQCLFRRFNSTKRSGFSYKETVDTMV